jgi:membrane glycosyltransferase
MDKKTTVAMTHGRYVSDGFTLRVYFYSTWNQPDTKNIILQSHIVCKTMLLLFRRHKLGMNMLQINCTTCFGLSGHHRVQRDFVIPLLLSAIPPYTGQCLHMGGVLYRWVICNALIWQNIKNIKVLKSALLKLLNTKMLNSQNLHY